MSKDSEKKMTGRSVELFLTTPLFCFRYKLKGVEKTLLENTVRVSGQIVSENNSGVHLRVSEISNMKEVEKELPFKELFVPFLKIDFIVFKD